MKRGGARRLEERADQSWQDDIREIRATARREHVSEEIVSEVRYGLAYETFRKRARRLDELGG
jgi:hypothetical protein